MERLHIGAGGVLETTFGRALGRVSVSVRVDVWGIYCRGRSWISLLEVPIKLGAYVRLPVVVECNILDDER